MKHPLDEDGMFHVKHDDEAVTLLRQLAEANVPIELAALELCMRHLDWVLDVNERVNLTSITDRAEAARLHVLDSLLALSSVNDSPPGLLIDLGTGGGFPGIPLAITTGRSTVLVDSVAKKLTALEPFLEREGLEHRITTFKGRSEDLAVADPGRASVVIARAVAGLPTLMEWAAPLLATGGTLLAMKAQYDEVEQSRARDAAPILGFSPPSVEEYTLPGGSECRSMVTFTKVAEPTLALPRRVGLAKKKPVA